jgi:branched-chain amino acid transport system permease protein
MMVGAFVALWVFNGLGLAPLWAVPAAFAVGMALGFVFFHASMKRLIKAPELASLLATFAIGILLEETVKLIYGADFHGYNWRVGSVSMGITVMPMSKIYAFLGSVIIALILYLWFTRTRSGTALTCVVEDSEGARVCGINVNRAYALSFSLGIGLTVASGVLLTMFIPVGINPYMGGVYTLKGFVIAVLGGLGSPYGAFFAGLIFGLLENGSYSFFALIPGLEPFAMTRFFSFLILLLILLIKPTGLLGTK